MYFRQFYDEWLAQASYMVGSDESKEALVVDPRRDIDVYLEAAAAHDLSIVAVTETHIHADFLSGSRELAAASGASLYLSGEGHDDGYLREDGGHIEFLRDGDQIELGELRIRALHTPGHTPEHMSFAVFASRDKAQPMLLLTGDFMFVGDLGRPDLLEEALGQTGAAKVGARRMYRSLERVLAQEPDFVQIWPGHGAGSACGRALGAVPSTTLGYERRFSWWSGYLERADEAGFARALLQDQPDAPTYFATMKHLNRGSMRLLNGLPQAPRLDANSVGALLEQGAVLVDSRPRELFVQSHAVGAIHIPDGSSFSSWSAWFIPSDSRVVLIAQPDRIGELVRALVHVGIDQIAGFVPQSIAAQLPQTPLPQINPADARERISREHAATLDVRSTAEYAEEHVPDALHISAGRLLREADRLPKDRPLIICCAQGERSTAAASVLAARGYTNILNLAGGFNGWRAADYPVAG